MVVTYERVASGWHRALATYGYKPNDDLATIVHQLKTSAVTFSYNYNQAHQRTQTAMTDDRYLFRPVANETVNHAANVLNQYTLVNSAALTYDTKGNPDRRRCRRFHL
jgi:hypothetical protein